MKKCLDCERDCKPSGKRCLKCSLACNKKRALEVRKSRENANRAQETCKECGKNFPRFRNAQAFCNKTCKEEFFFKKATQAWLNAKKRGGRQISYNFVGFIDRR